MRILVDGRYAAQPFVGVARHTCAVLRALVDLPGDEEYVVLWNDSLVPHADAFRAVLAHARVTVARVNASPFRLASVPATTRAFRAARPDVFYSPFYLLPLAATCPAVLTVHDVRPLSPRWDAPLARLLFRAALARARRAARVLAVSAFTRDEMVRRAGFDPARIVVTPPGADEAGALPIDPRPPARIPPGAFALVVGSNRPHKNQALLLDAWRALGSDAPLALVLAGPVDPRFPDLAARAREQGLDRVHVLGRVDAAELEWLYRHASALLLPSLYEGAGLPLFEAWARGCPVLASDIPACREFGEGAALLLPADDAGAWRSAIVRIASDQGERERLARAGALRAHAARWEDNARAVREACRAAIAR